MFAWQSPCPVSVALAFRADMIKGYILEASPLPKLPVTGLDPVSDSTQETFGVCLDHQSTEEESVNGRDNQVKYKPVIPRYPFVLLLDGIVSILPVIIHLHACPRLTFRIARSRQPWRHLTYRILPRRRRRGHLLRPFRATHSRCAQSVRGSLRSPTSALRLQPIQICRRCP